MIAEDKKNEIVAEILQNFLLEGDSDYIGLFQIMNKAALVANIDDRNSLSTEDSNKLLQATLAFVMLLLNNGFEIVDLTKDGKCTPWPDQGIQIISEKIATAWVFAQKTSKWIGFEFWFNKIKKNIVIAST